mmetsp:Transcript_17124/g.19250  ORF Transcript_17124/g.19250 Transcript_17124/m.19250 type:complete len:177 (-) Transcript_17124:301-831(-)
MGSLFSIFEDKQVYRMCMLGLDAAGKTTILQQMKKIRNVHTVAPVGLHSECLEYRNMHYTIWDGAQDNSRFLWKSYYVGSDAVIFVVDSTDEYRIELVAEELKMLFADPELIDVKILVFANKQDNAKALTTKAISDKLGLTKMRTRTWHVQSCSAKHNKGLSEGFEWLSKALNTKS